MEDLITMVYLTAGCCLLAVSCAMAVFIWRCLPGHGRPGSQQTQEETEEEKEARRLAAEAQMRYEQGFVNLMNYDGRPNKRKEGVL